MREHTGRLHDLYLNTHCGLSCSMRHPSKIKALHDPEAARCAFQALRWPDGPTCPACGTSDEESIVELSAAYGACRYHCRVCRKRFSATINTIFHRTRVGFAQWWLAVHLLSAEREKVRIEDVRCALGVCYKTAWQLVQTILDAAGAYAGERNGLGVPISRYMEKVRSGSVMNDKRYTGKSQQFPTTDFLQGRSAPALRGIPITTVNLMSLLVSTDPKSKDLENTRKKSAAKRKLSRLIGIG